MITNRFEMEDVRRFWDEVAPEYEHENELVGWVHTQRFREALSRLELVPEMSILNVWCRIGGAIPFLRAAEPGLKLVNAELSMGFLRRARSNYPKENFVQVSLHDLPFCDGSFDAVVSLETLEHVPEPFRFLSELRRVMRRGGILVMSLPPSSAEWTSLLNSVLSFHHGEGPHRFLSPGEVKNMLKASKLELLEHRGTLFLPLKWSVFECLDKGLSRAFGSGPLASLGLRQFYVCKAA